jgi:hypothetical protein
MKKTMVFLILGVWPATAAAEECSAPPFTVSANVTLEGSKDGRADRLGTACRLLGSFIGTAPTMCQAATAACTEQPNGVLRIMAPWASEAYTNVDCATFVSLSCSEDRDVDRLTLACREAMTGQPAEDPLFVSPVSAACGMFVGFGTFGAAWSTNAIYPMFASTTGLLTLIPTIVGAIGCALVPF